MDMMTILYNTGIFFYHLLIRILSPLNKKARLYLTGRKNWLSVLQASVDAQARYIWFHCASLGEFEQGRPVIEAVKKELPRYKIILTFFSPSGYEIRKNYPLTDVVCYLPADTRRNAALFIETVRPEIVFFIKYEFWYNYISQIKKKGIPLFLVSGIFRKDQVFFSRMPWGDWFREMLGAFSHFFLQDRESAALLSGIGITKCTVSGDTRFDRVAAIANSSQPVPIVEKFSAGKPLLIAGSTWEPDEALLVPFINNHPGMKFIIAPHEVNRGNINRLVQMLKKPPIMFSQATENNIDNFDVMVVDSVGILSSLYRYGKYAYIGGGFGVGIHNILEAATFGLPVFFGPNYSKFREACQLVEKGGAFPVSSAESFEQAFRQLAENPEFLKKASETASIYVKLNQGATGIILNYILSEFHPVLNSVGKS
jgi:3-deoxy-D-manno-octulosonic-acid transferase